ncbi:hypothetical protein XarbCFBP8150_21730, partial [Xanthomonas arboricola]|uniref:sialate O-acetylesterase n=1 Tax=Xanthomonas arboricola TaxID=56448 RepID=UPI000D447C17
MIHPLQPFPVKGVIWYQGETNASDTGALKYREQFAAMIQQWRAGVAGIGFALVPDHALDRERLQRMDH